MNSGSQPLLSPPALAARMQEPNVVLVDACFDKEAYKKQHLRGAIHVSLNEDLSDIKEDPAAGGRHPLPSPEDFGKTLGKLGINPDSQVIVYDDKLAGMSAARFWWMLRAVGHSRVQVLDGGIQAAIAAGFPTASGEELPTAGADYPVQQWRLPLAEMEEVGRKAGAEDGRVIDVREAVRYSGASEPIDLVAGHIPGALNVPFSENLGEDGFFLPAGTLKAKYERILAGTSPENSIVHCGSGVTACHTLLAMAHAGLEIPKLYVGSWSEWSRNGRPIAKEL
ncbi:sulfurtransferase [Cyclobacterium xiamenense]|uniref:sulfurtransferase n=1 Tax=Cyclobacterium xiamenense TaxID=1297121 RepID=UPI0035D02B8A